MTSPETATTTVTETDALASADAAAVTMYSTPWCGYCHRLKGQMDRAGIDYQVVDIEQVPDAAAIVERVNNGNQTVPTLVYADGTAQTNPSLAQVKAKLDSLA
jgi:mycoredoxin